METKIFILKSIRDKKNILFGQFSDTLTKKDKEQAWEEVRRVAESLGALTSKDWKFVRDTWWPNVRRGTMTKVDNARKTGSGGGKENNFTALDNIVLDILGKESAVINSLGISSSLPRSKSSCTPTTSAPIFTLSATVPCAPNINSISSTSLPLTSASQFISNIPSSSATSTSLPARQAPQPKKKRKQNFTENIQALQLKKLKLQVEHLEMVNRKIKLEIFKLEQEGGFGLSKYSESLFDHVEGIIDGSEEEQVSSNDLET